MDNVMLKDAPVFDAPAAIPNLKVKTPIHWWLVIITLLASGLIIYWFIVRPRMAVATVTVPDYITSQVARRDFTVSVSGSATVQSAESSSVTTLVKGEVLSAPFEEGRTVQVGDLLYQIDSSDLEATIEKSELSLERARNSYSDILKSIETTKTDRAKAAGELTLAAPSGGLVTALYVAVGDEISPGTLIAELIDRENLLLQVPFHSAAAAGISVGQTATVTVDGTGETLSGTVSKLAVLDEAGPGGTLVRTVTIAVRNPGTITESTSATAAVGGAASAATGSFAFAARETVTAKKAGTIASISIQEGSRVERGQTILTLDAEAALASYDKQLETLQNSVRDAALSLRDAETGLENTKQQLESYSIYSTIDGTVIEKNIAQGDHVEGTSAGALAVIFNMTRLQFELNIDELDIGSIQVGQTVRITAEAVSGGQFSGKVARINYNGKSANGVTTYPVTVTVDEPDRLLPGMNVTAEILVEEANQVLCVPINAVQRGGTVLIPGEGAIAEDGSIDETKLIETPVTTGRTNGMYIEITDGLSEGDAIVVKTQLSSSSGSFQMSGGMTFSGTRGVMPGQGGGSVTAIRVMP